MIAIMEGCHRQLVSSTGQNEFNFIHLTYYLRNE